MDAVSDADLAALDAEVERALATGDDSRLRVLGYGEISLVLGWPASEPVVAAKRLPVFPTRERFEAYRVSLEDYLAGLRDAGVDVLESEVRTVERSDGLAAYVVQPAFPSSTLVTKILAATDAAAGHPSVRAIADLVAAVVRPTLGFDAQISNWLWVDGRLRYLDVTTPLIWTEDGASRLDLDMQTRALPWALRGIVRRFVAPGILDKYRDRRGVLLDICANLIKERLEPWMPAFLEAVNAHASPAISSEDARRYYRSDARTWEFLLKIRRLDRAWQRRVRRRPYPFLLPKQIAR